MNQKLQIYFCVLLLAGISIGCSAIRLTGDKAMKSDNNCWEHIGSGFKKNCKKCSDIKNTAILKQKLKEDKIHNYYLEALFSLNNEKGVLAKQKTALRNITKALEYWPSNIEYRRVKNELRIVILNLNDKISDGFKKAIINRGEKKYIDAYNGCKEILRIDPLNKKTKKLIEKLKIQGHKFYLKKAIVLEQNDEYKLSIQLLEFASELSKTTTATESLSRVQKKFKALTIYNNIIKKLSTRERLTEINSIRAMVALDNTNEKYRNILMAVLTDKINRYFGLKEYKNAIEMILECKRVGVTKHRIKRELSRLEKQAVKIINDNAEKYYSAKRYGASLELLLWLEQRGLLDEKGRNKKRIVRNLVLEKVTPNIKITPFTGRGSTLNALGDEFSTELYQRVAMDKIYKCKITLDDNKLSGNKTESNWISVKDNIENFEIIRKCDGSSLILVGNVELYEFDHVIDNVVETKTSYIRDYQQEINPEYSEYMTERSLGDLLFSSVLKTVTGSTFFSSPKKYIQKPLYGYQKKRIEEHHVKSSMILSFAVIEQSTSKIILKKTISKKIDITENNIDVHEGTIRKNLFKKAIESTCLELILFLNKIPDVFYKHSEVEKLSNNLKKAKEYYVMAAVASSRPLTIAETLWPSNQEAGIHFTEGGGGLAVDFVENKDSQLKEKDIILKINNIPVTEKQHALRLMADSGNSSLIKVDLKRNNKIRKVFIVNPIH